MKEGIFVNKYSTIKAELAECIPAMTQVFELDSKCALLILPRAQKRKDVMALCRKQLGEAKRDLIQVVNSYRESGDSIEITLPDMKRFFPKPGMRNG